MFRCSTIQKIIANLAADIRKRSPHLRGSEIEAMVESADFEMLKSLVRVHVNHNNEVLYGFVYSGQTGMLRSIQRFLNHSNRWEDESE